jgi:hypothetical protein
MKNILTSIEGRRLGIDSDGNLLFDGAPIAGPDAAGASAFSNVVTLTNGDFTDGQYLVTAQQSGTLFIVNAGDIYPYQMELPEDAPVGWFARFVATKYVPPYQTDATQTRMKTLDIHTDEPGYQVDLAFRGISKVNTHCDVHCVENTDGGSAAYVHAGPHLWGNLPAIAPATTYTISIDNAGAARTVGTRYIFDQYNSMTIADWGGYAPHSISWAWYRGNGVYDELIPQTEFDATYILRDFDIGYTIYAGVTGENRYGSKTYLSNATGTVIAA